jgi:hypothetical protein
MNDHGHETMIEPLPQRLPATLSSEHKVIMSQWHWMIRETGLRWSELRATTQFIPAPKVSK